MIETTAQKFDSVMGLLWGCVPDADKHKVPMEIRAIAGFVKTHNRINAENAFDVLDLMWKHERAITLRDVEEIGSPAERRFNFHVMFLDGSECVVIGEGCIGSGIELI